MKVFVFSCLTILLFSKLESGRPVVLPTGITTANLRLKAGAPSHVVVDGGIEVWYYLDAEGRQAAYIIKNGHVADRRPLKLPQS